MKSTRILLISAAIASLQLALFPGFGQTNVARTGRFSRGAGTNTTYQSFVFPLDFQKGVALDNMNGNATNLFPYAGTDYMFGETRYHYDATQPASSTNLTLRIPFNNPIAAFGSRVGGSPLYFNQDYHFGAYAGVTAPWSTGAVCIVVFRASDYEYIDSVPFEIPALADTNLWRSFLTNGYQASLTTYGLTTTLRFDDPFPMWGIDYGAGCYHIVHNATQTSTNYIYEVIMSGYTDGDWLVKDVSGYGVWSRLYTLEFQERPPWRAVFLDQPQFTGEPAPPFYQGRSLPELLTNAPPVTNTVFLAPSACTNLDASPELRRHPILDQFVLDMRRDPIALANYVHNEIELTDALAYNDNGAISDISINLGGVNRSALGAFLEKQGSPLEQCSLLIYLLRQAGIPAAYVFPAENGLKMLDTQLSKLLRMQIRGALNYTSGANDLPYTTDSLIPVNYPWVAAYVGTNWVHLFPWLKDTEIVEGLNLYNYLPAAYKTSYQWVRDYLQGRTNIMSLSSDDDTPRTLFPLFVKQILATNAPGISLEDIGVQVFNRRHLYARWNDFPRPPVVTNSSIAIESLASSSITNVNPRLTNIFDTVTVTVSSVTNSATKLTTGTLRMLDLHNRKFVIRHEKISSTSHRMIMTLEPYRPGTSGIGTFVNDADLLKQQSITNTLGTTDDSLTVQFTFNRHRSLPVGFVQPGDTVPYLGLTEWTSFTNNRSLRKGDLAAVCLDVGRVTPAMLQLHAQELWNMESTLRANPSATNSLSPDIYQGAVAYLMGMAYHEQIGRFDILNQHLHKVQVLSQITFCLAGVRAARDANAQLPTGNIDLVQPSVDMFHKEVAIAGNTTIRQDSGEDGFVPNDDYFHLYIADSSAQEHSIINHYFHQTDAVSTMKLLQLAQAKSATNGQPGILMLDYFNYQTEANRNYPTTGTTKLKDQSPTIWSRITNSFGSYPSPHENYVQAFITPGPVTNQSSSFKGMAALILEPVGAVAAIAEKNGGWGANNPANSLALGNAPNISLSVDADNNYSLSLAPPNLDNSVVAPDSYATYNSGNVLNNANLNYYNYTANQNTWSGELIDYLGLTPQGSPNLNFAQAVQAAEGNNGFFGWLSDALSQAGSRVFDPVHAVTGEFYVNAADLTLPGPMPLSVNRNYSSLNLADNQFGFGWKLDYMPYLSLNSDATVIYAAEADGAVLAYERTATNANVFLPTTGKNPQLNNNRTAGIGSVANRLRNRIDKQVSGPDTFYYLTAPDGSKRTFKVMTFTGSVNQTRPYLTRWEDSRGNFFTSEYGTDATQPDYGQARRVQSSNGNYLGFYFDVYGHIVEAYTGDGRRLYYEYDQFGDLVKVTLPDASEMSYEYQHVTGPFSVATPADSSVDVALSGTATQSSYYQNSPVAGAAIDNNTDGVYTHGSATCTLLDPNAWWQVDLQTNRNIRTIKLWNRAEVPERLSNYYVLVSASPLSANLQTNLNQPAVGKYYQAATAGRPTALAINRAGRYIQVQLAGTNFLSLAEVQVYEPVYTLVTNTYSTHLLAREEKPDGRVLQNEYDEHRRVTNQWSTVGADLTLVRNATFIYSNNFNLTNSFTNTITGFTLIKDVNNNTNRYDYTNGLITRIMDALNQTEVQDWFEASETNKAGYYPRSLESRTDKRGLVTVFKYDSTGNVTNAVVTGDLLGDGTTQSATNTVVYDANSLPTLTADPVGNKVQTLYHSQYPFLPEYNIRLAGSTAVSTNKLVYGNVTNTFVSGGATYTNIALGVVQQEIRAFGSPDAATNEWTRDGRGFITQSIRYTGTPDPAVTETFFCSDRGVVIEQADALGRRTTFDYDGLNRPIAREVFEPGQSAPLAWEYSYYNPNGELTWSDGPRYNPEDYVWRDYDGAGRLITEIQWRSQGRADGAGVEAPAGDDLFATTFRQYDAFGNLTCVVDPRGAITTNSWDKLGRLVQRKFLDLDGSSVLGSEGFAYEPGGLVRYFTNALNGLTETQYTATGQPRFRRNADGSTNAWRYYADGRVWREFQGNGAYWQTSHDDANRKTTRVFYSAGGVALATNWTVLDRRGNVIQQSDAGFNVYTNAYDGLDRLKVAAGPLMTNVVLVSPPSTFVTNVSQQITTYSYDAAGKTNISVNALGDKTITTSDALRRPVAVEVRDTNNVLARVTTTVYSQDHHSVTVTNGSGSSAIASTVYTDTEGHQVLSVAYPAANVREFTLSAFDVAGNLGYQERDSSSNGVVTGWSASAFAYDGLNRPVWKSERDGAETSFGYDPLGNETNRVMPGGLQWQATYDNAGRRLTELDRSGGQTTRSVSYNYYSAGHPWAGLLQSVTDGRGVARTTTYNDWRDVAGFTTSGALAEQQMSVAWQYDARRLPTEITQSFAGTNTGPTTSVRRTFNPYGLLISENVTLGGGLLSFASQTWNVAGRRTQLAHLGWSVGFQYRADGLMSAANDATFGYGNNGLLSGRTNSFRSMTLTSRDGAGRPAQAVTRVGVSTPLTESWTWTGDGLPNSYTAARSDFTDTRRFTYGDLHRRLSQETLNLGAGQSVTNTYTFDQGQSGGLGVMTLANQSGSFTGSWSVASTNQDAFKRVAGERSTAPRRVARGTVNGPSVLRGNVNGRPVDLHYNAAIGGAWSGEIEVAPGANTLTVYADHPSGMFSTNRVSTFTVNAAAADAVETKFDGGGYITNRVWKNSQGQTERTQNLTWDAFGRLVKQTERDSGNNGYNWQADFDPLGRRVWTVTVPVTNNVTIMAQQRTLTHFYDPQVEFLEVGLSVNGTTTWKTYGPDVDGRYGGQQGLGGLESLTTGSSSIGVIQDGFGNVLGSAANSTVTWNASKLNLYGPVDGYPALSLSVGPLSTEHLAWRGKWRDEAGFYYWGARPYEAERRSFLRPDPLGYNATPSLYAAFGSRPSDIWDPDGRLGKNWVEKSDSIDVTGVGSFFEKSFFGAAGAIMQGIGSTPSVMDQAGQGMAQARQDISQYEGGQAFLARSLMLPADFAFGTTKLVNDPVNTVAGMPEGFVNFGAKIGTDVYSVGANPSVNTAFNIVEDTLGVAGTAEGGVGLYRGANSLLGQSATPKVFWSGGTPARQAAEAYAEATGGQTLEMTGTGVVLDALTTKWTYPLLRPLWNKASFDFAASAQGPVDVFQSASRGVRLESVWRQVEYPQLMKQGNQINYRLAP